MSSDEISLLASNADMIVGGYAFSRMEESKFRVIDLKAPHHALILSSNDEVLETTMNDVELTIVQEYWKKNKKYLEESYAEVL